MALTHQLNVSLHQQRSQIHYVPLQCCIDYWYRSPQLMNSLLSRFNSPKKETQHCLPAHLMGFLNMLSCPLLPPWIEGPDKGWCPWSRSTDHRSKSQSLCASLILGNPIPQNWCRSSFCKEVKRFWRITSTPLTADIIANGIACSFIHTHAGLSVHTIHVQILSHCCHSCPYPQLLHEISSEWAVQKCCWSSSILQKQVLHH